MAIVIDWGDADTPGFRVLDQRSGRPVIAPMGLPDIRLEMSNELALQLQHLDRTIKVLGRAEGALFGATDGNALVLEDIQTLLVDLGQPAPRHPEQEATTVTVGVEG